MWRAPGEQDHRQRDDEVDRLPVEHALRDARLRRLHLLDVGRAAVEQALLVVEGDVVGTPAAERREREQCDRVRAWRQA